MKKLLWVLAPLLFLACNVTKTDVVGNLSILEKQLTEELEAITETYSEDNHGIIYTVFKNDTAIIQVVHSSFIAEVKGPDSKFGLAIAISFDETFSEEIVNHKKFKNSKYFSEFEAYEWNGVPCYAVNMEMDFQLTAKMVTDILTDIYGFTQITNFETDLHDQGSL